MDTIRKGQIALVIFKKALSELADMDIIEIHDTADELDIAPVELMSFTKIIRRELKAERLEREKALERMGSPELMADLAKK